MPGCGGPVRPAIEQVVPGGIRASDHLHVDTNDGTCSRCRRPIADDDATLLLWIGDEGRLMYAFCAGCCGEPAVDRARRRWGMG